MLDYYSRDVTYCDVTLRCSAMKNLHSCHDNYCYCIEYIEVTGGRSLKKQNRGYSCIPCICNNLYLYWVTKVLSTNRYTLCFFKINIQQSIITGNKLNTDSSKLIKSEIERLQTRGVNNYKYPNNDVIVFRAASPQAGRTGPALCLFQTETNIEIMHNNVRKLNYYKLLNK